MFSVGRSRVLSRLLAAMSGVLLFCAPLCSQESFGRILGNVTDPTVPDRGVTRGLVGHFRNTPTYPGPVTGLLPMAC